MGEPYERFERFRVAQIVATAAGMPLPPNWPPQPTATAEESKPVEDPQRLADDKIMAYWNTFSEVEKRVCVKLWRAENPNEGSSIDELNRAIRKLLK